MGRCKYRLEKVKLGIVRVGEGTENRNVFFEGRGVRIEVWKFIGEGWGERVLNVVLGVK